MSCDSEDFWEPPKKPQKTPPNYSQFAMIVDESTTMKELEIKIENSIQIDRLLKTIFDINYKKAVPKPAEFDGASYFPCKMDYYKVRMEMYRNLVKN